MAKLFGKKDQEQAEHPVPAELEQYYERNGWRKWLRYVVGVIIVLVLLFGIFLLARAVYRNVTDEDTDKDKGGSSQNESKESKSDKNKDKEQGAAKGQQNPSSQSQGGTGTTNQDNTSPTTVPRTGDDPSDLPATGDNPTDQPSTPTTLPSTGG